jgi:hypothetical protein
LTIFELGLSLTVFESIDIEMLIPAFGGKSFSFDSFLNKHVIHNDETEKTYLRAIPLVGDSTYNFAAIIVCSL